jgi:hypothetical protein
MGIADTGKHEQARRLDYTRAENCFPFGPDLMTSCPEIHPDTCATLSIEREGLDAASGQ